MKLTWRLAALSVLSMVVAAPATVNAAQAGSGGLDERLFSQLRWRNIGPSRGGRSVAVTGVPGQPLVYYMGATGGGVFKTDDAGQSWRPVSDAFFKTGSVGAIQVAPSDPNVVYVGMGEACIRGNFSHGDGVYKSNDAGKTWKHMGLGDTRQIGRIRVHPQDPNLVYVAALGHIFGPNEERGIFRSKDGGETWERVLYIDDKTGAIDLAMDATNPRVMYAAFWAVSRTAYGLYSGGPGSGIYKSTDGGDTWNELTNGLPRGIKGRIGIAVSPVNPERVWAIVEADDGGIFRSDNGGQSFQLLNGDRNWRQRAWYYTHIYADTQSADTVYVLNTALGKSTDGGRTYTSLRPPHGDNHDLWIAPEDSRRMINANDGGANVSFNAGASWSQQNGQPTAQFYHVITDNQFPYRVYGAQQDNSTVSVLSTASAASQPEFYSVGGGESGYIAPHPENSDIVYAGSYGGLLTRYNHRTGTTRNVSVWPDNPMGWGAEHLKYRFQWTFPIVISPHDPETVYTAGNVLFKSNNGGQSWDAISGDLTTNDKSKQGPSGGMLTHDNTSVEYYCTIFAVAESTLQAGVIWTGSDDGLIHVTRDGGKSWKDVTPLDAPKWGMVSIIDPSPHDPAAAYAAITKFKSDDFAPYLFKTSDYGETWKQINKGIARDAFTRAIREDPERRGLLYAGTETGMYISFDDGGNWQPLQLNLPVVPITDLVVKGDDLVIATQGRAFWILDGLSHLRQVDVAVASAKVHLFTPGKTYRSIDRGVNVEYYLGERPSGPVTLDFLDGSGEVIRSFSSRGSAGPAPSGRGGGRGRGAGGSRRVSTNVGVNRFTWDMRYPDATNVPGAVLWGGSTRGPAASPGEYQARLTVDGETLSTKIEILKDPRIAATQQDLDNQFALLIKIRDRVSETSDAINDIRSVKAQITAATEKVQAFNGGGEEVSAAGKALAAKLTAIEEELIQVKSRSSQDPLNFPIKLNNKLAALSGVAGRGDFGPTDQVYAAFEDLSAQLQVQLDALAEVLDSDIAGFNDLVKAQDVPAITLKRKQ